MIQQVLKFMELSRRWSEAKRGADVARYAIDALPSLFHVDAGFFVFQRTGKILGTSREPVMVDHAFGPVSGFTDEITYHIRTGDWFRPSAVKANCWIPAAEAGEPWQGILERCRLAQFGVWPIRIRDELFAALVLGRTNPQLSNDVDIMNMCANQIALVLELVIARRIAESYGSRDFLTGLLNRGGLLDLVDGFREEANAGAQSLVLGILDVNDFKEINDGYGHLRGDEVLQDVARKLERFVGNRGLCSRWGGDEFVFVFKTDALEPELAGIKGLFSAFDPSYHVSVGCATFGKDGETWDDVFGAADRRLYDVKETNRNS